MKLTGPHASPCIRKVRAALVEKKVDYQFVLEDVWSAVTQIHQSDPPGKVSCLVMDDGNVLSNSHVTAEYADTLSPVTRFVPSSSRERVEMCCQEALANDSLDAALMLRIKYTQRTPEQRSEAWFVRQSHKTDRTLQTMSQGLVDKIWCNGNHLTLADIAVSCTFAYLDFRQS